jgi:N-acetylmuramoyl-L-alanine amidase
LSLVLVFGLGFASAGAGAVVPVSPRTSVAAATAAAVASAEASATPAPPVTPPPTPVLKTLVGGKGTLQATWKPVAAAKGYQVQYRVAKTTTWKQAGVAAGKTTATFKGLPKGKVYHLQIRAYATSPQGARIYSGWSNTLKTLVPLATVVIDAGHQARANSKLEPIGPGAKTKKPKVAGGTRGARTHKPESKLTLEVALKLEKELKARGIKVIMIRRTQKVNIPNSKRAKIANKAHADLFIRLHADGSARASTHGISTLIPKKNKWTKKIVKKSASAGKVIQKALIKKTGAKNRGVIKRGDLSGFNWCKVPTVLVEMGFMTNPKEDKKMSTKSYQKKLATGMATGIVKWLR